MIPEPEVEAHLIDASETPTGPRRLAKLAAEHGFVVRITHSRGPFLNADGSVNRIADSVLVVAGRKPRHLGVLWVADAAGKYVREFGYCWDNARPRPATHKAINDYIKEV